MCIRDSAKGDQLQLKANAPSLDGKELINGELVTVAGVNPKGQIELKDGRISVSYTHLVAVSFEEFVCVSINQSFQFFVGQFEGDDFESVRRYICEPAAAHAALAANPASQIQSPVHGRPSDRHSHATALLSLIHIFSVMQTSRKISVNAASKMVSAISLGVF